HRLPPQGQQQRRPPDRPGPGMRPGMPGGQRPAAPGMQGRGPAPATPGGRPPFGRSPLIPPPPPTATDQQRRGPAQRHEVDRSQRYERQAEKRLESPFVRPQPKVEAPREHRSITLTEGVTVKELAEKLDVKTKDMITKLMTRGVFA